MRESSDQTDEFDITTGIEDKLTPQELKQLELRFVMRRWDAENRSQQHHHAKSHQQARRRAVRVPV